MFTTRILRENSQDIQEPPLIGFWLCFLRSPTTFLIHKCFRASRQLILPSRVFWITIKMFRPKETL
jgi:hypothetical protein